MWVIIIQLIFALVTLPFMFVALAAIWLSNGGQFTAGDRYEVNRFTKFFYGFKLL